MINEAMPEVIPICMPIKSNENCKANMINPYSMTILNEAAGGLMKKIAGTLANRKRNAQRNKGENSFRLNLTKIKFKPQAITTNNAKRVCLIGIMFLSGMNVCILT